MDGWVNEKAAARFPTEYHYKYAHTDSFVYYYYNYATTNSLGGIIVSKLSSKLFTKRAESTSPSSNFTSNLTLTLRDSYPSGTSLMTLEGVPIISSKRSPEGVMFDNEVFLKSKLKFCT